MKPIPFSATGFIMRRVHQILFVAPAPVVWAQHLDSFGKRGLDLQTTRTTSSDQIGQGLADGDFDVGIGVVDNVLAWNAERHAGLKIMAQLERTQVMAFCAVPGCDTLAEASRRTIAVDSTTNGFVLVLYRALAAAGIDRAACRFDPVGGVRQRFEALMQRQVGATILVPPFIDMAIEQGCNVLWRGEEMAPDYPGVVATARAGWLAESRPLALDYVGALLEANEWAMDPAHHDLATSALTAAGYAEPAARRLVEGAVAGLQPSVVGWDEVVGLRRSCGLLDGAGPAFDAVVDGDLRRCAAGSKRTATPDNQT
jgi:ABC-type nitrate/sulfonate/bicarbonate transport system substrate-binding protein